MPSLIRDSHIPYFYIQSSRIEDNLSHLNELMPEESPDSGDYIGTLNPDKKLVLPKVNETQKPQFNAVDTTGNLKRFIETYLQTKSSEFDYDDWIRLGMGLVFELKEEGRYYFHELSKPDSRYDYKECDRLYTDLMKRGYQKVTGGTIRMLLS